MPNLTVIYVIFTDQFRKIIACLFLRPYLSASTILVRQLLNISTHSYKLNTSYLALNIPKGSVPNEYPNSVNLLHSQTYFFENYSEDS